MSQQSKAGIFLLSFLALALVLYLLFSTKNETIRYSQEDQPQNLLLTEKVNKLEKISQIEIESNYKNNLKKIFSDFESKVNALAFSEDASAENESTSSTDLQIDPISQVINDLSELKVSVMGMTVPEDLRDFHFSLVKELSDEKERIKEARAFDEKELLAIIEKSRENN